MFFLVECVFKAEKRNNHENELIERITFAFPLIFNSLMFLLKFKFLNIPFSTCFFSSILLEGKVLKSKWFMSDIFLYLVIILQN